MASQTQSFENHTRYFPLFHFIASPLLAIYLVYTLYVLVRVPSPAALANVVLAAGVNAALFASRTMVLVVQNRVIRLEMRLRLERVLGAAAAADALTNLAPARLIALRFASDAELPALIARVRSNDQTSLASRSASMREMS